MSTELLVDLGHSRLKWGRAAGGQLLEQAGGEAALADLDDLAGVFAEEPPGSTVWCSAQSAPEARAQLTGLASQFGLKLEVIATGCCNLEVMPAYNELGCDRWLAMQWPWRQSRRTLMVADCGTALSIDIVDDRGRHRGGWIMAGLQTARSGLLSRAPGLKMPADTRAQFAAPATSTAEAIAAGGLLQLAGAIERAARAAATMLAEPPELWLTGGDAAAVKPLIDAAIIHDDRLVLRGLALAAEAK